MRRLLRLAGRVGAFTPHRPHRVPVRRSQETRALLRRAAAAGSVLLSNRGVLPLDPAELSTVAVIGAHAASPRTQGGGSAGVFPSDVVSPLAGIRARLRGRARVVHVPGPPPPSLASVPLDTDRCSDPRSGAPGVLLRVLDESGRELRAEHRFSGRQLEPDLPPGAHTVEISALLRPRRTGEWTFGVAGFGRMTLTVDGLTILDGVFPRETDDPAVVHVNPPVQGARATLTSKRPVHVVARRELVPGCGRATVVTAAPPEADAQSMTAAAAEAAREADVAIVVVGTTEHDETEGYDLSDLSLGGQQDDLVRAVAAANPRTVVVVISGGPVELPWRQDVGAVLLAWFPGQEAGTGLADVLFGLEEPGGRLPTTWGSSLADTPVTRTRPAGGRLDYAEGLHRPSGLAAGRPGTGLLVRPRTRVHHLGVRSRRRADKGHDGRRVHRAGTPSQHGDPRRAGGRPGLRGPAGVGRRSGPYAGSPATRRSGRRRAGRCPPRWRWWPAPCVTGRRRQAPGPRSPGRTGSWWAGRRGTRGGKGR